MTSNEIRRVQAHLYSFDDELSSWLTQGVRAKTTVEPNTLHREHQQTRSEDSTTFREFTYRPPGAIGLVMLELPRKEHGDEYLEYTPLDTDDRDYAKNRMRCIPKLQEPLRSAFSVHDPATSCACSYIPGTQRRRSFQSLHRNVQ